MKVTFNMEVKEHFTVYKLGETYDLARSHARHLLTTGKVRVYEEPQRTPEDVVSKSDSDTDLEVSTETSKEG